MNNFHEKKAHKTTRVNFNLLINPKYTLKPSPLLHERFVRFHKTLKSKTKTKINLIQRNFSKSDKHLLNIPFIAFLRKKYSEKEKKNERIRQNILLKIKQKYSQRVPSDYYIMIISNLLSPKQNKLKSNYTELLNIIETKELLSNYFIIKESKIKLVYLTKLFANNIKIFPNYILNDKIYHIMSNYLIEKERLIVRIENNTRINILKEKLLQYTNKEKEKERGIEEIETSKNRKAIDSFSDSSKFYLEEKLKDLEIKENSFNYSYGKKSDSINKVKDLINDISKFLNNNDIDNVGDYSKENKKFLKEKKIKIKLNYLDKKPILLKSLKKNEDYIKKTRAVDMPFSFNKNKIIKNIIFSNLVHNKRVKFFKLPQKKAENSKEIKIKYNKAHKYILNQEQININQPKNFQTISNQYTDNNIYLNTTKTNGNTNTISTLSGASYKKNYFKPTNNFLYFIYRNEIKEKAKIKNSILDFVKKFGLSKNKSENIKEKEKLNKDNLSYKYKKQSNYGTNRGLSLNANKENKNDNKNIFGLIERKNKVDYFLPQKFTSIKKTEFYYTDLPDRKNVNHLLSQSQSERIEINFKRFKKNIKNSEQIIIKDNNKYNIYSKIIKN